jgi:hypothetical protein
MECSSGRRSSLSVQQRDAKMIEIEANEASGGGSVWNQTFDAVVQRKIEQLVHGRL